jgi:hypothetical protein
MRQIIPPSDHRVTEDGSHLYQYGAEYEGELNNNYYKHGIGKMTFPDGSFIEGKWENDNPPKDFIFTASDKTKYTPQKKMVLVEGSDGYYAEEFCGFYNVKIHDDKSFPGGCRCGGSKP